QFIKQAQAARSHECEFANATDPVARLFFKLASILGCLFAIDSGKVRAAQGSPKMCETGEDEGTMQESARRPKSGPPRRGKSREQIIKEHQAFPFHVIQNLVQKLVKHGVCQIISRD